MGGREDCLASPDPHRRCPALDSGAPSRGAHPFGVCGSIVSRHCKPNKNIESQQGCIFRTKISQKMLHAAPSSFQLHPVSPPWTVLDRQRWLDRGVDVRNLLVHGSASTRGRRGEWGKMGRSAGSNWGGGTELQEGQRDTTLGSESLSAAACDLWQGNCPHADIPRAHMGMKTYHWQNQLTI